MAPGPGVYEVSNAARLAKGRISPKITIGKKVNESLKLSNIESLPGPGTYDISIEKEKKKKAYSIGLRYTNQLANSVSVPGPGTYNVDSAHSVKTLGGAGSKSGASFSFPMDERNASRDIEKKSKDMPDPTSY